MLLREIIFTPGKPLVVAHRGASGVAPENTMAAIRSALAAGADMIEVDIQLTREGEIVVFHDATLGRTTNGKGFVRKKTLPELQLLDAGSWFAKKYSAEKILTLNQALEEIGTKAFINIEIKPHAVRIGKNAAIEKLLIATIREHNLEERVLLSSFLPLPLRRIKKISPRLATAVIQLPFLREIPPSVLARRAGGAEVYVCSLRELTSRRVADAHKAGLRVSVYTINNKKDYTTAVALGADAIVTNFPEKFK